MAEQDPLVGKTIASTEQYLDLHDQLDTLVLVMTDGTRFSIEVEVGHDGKPDHLTVGEET